MNLRLSSNPGTKQMKVPNVVIRRPIPTVYIDELQVCKQAPIEAVAEDIAE